jgi:ADP-dependent NAD(P)H-hydrate dehydratase / NAD(P)H-hydrate epimerase
MSFRSPVKNYAQWAYLSQQVKQYEGHAAQISGASLYTLMQRAGAAVFKRWQTFNAQQTLVLVGNGNNAGDGYVVASLIKRADRHVVVCAVDADKTLTGDAATAQQSWIKAGGGICNFSLELIDECDVIIDALLGTGLNNTVRDSFVEMIAAANKSNKPILSIDVPSGINADTGQPQGVAIRATETITFVGIKQGLTTAAGKQHVGELHFDDLDIGEQFTHLATASARIINSHSFTGLTAREINSHKGSHGKLLCIGGNQGTAGAIRLSGEAALRAGAGMVKVYTHKHAVLAVSLGRPELMVTSDNLSAALAWASCLVIGPGLGQDDWAHATFVQSVQYCLQHNIPVVIDADGLNLLAKTAANFTLQQAIVTPHAGEASRLLNSSVTAIEADRFKSARQCAINYNVTCVLKGAGSIIDNGAQTYVCQDGSPALSVAGSGDVLTGIIGALLAQGMDVDSAAAYGVCLHAKAGDIAANRAGLRGMLASDLFSIVRELVN